MTYQGKIKRVEVPLCITCEGPAQYQLGIYVPFKSRAVGWCEAHLPNWARQALAEQDAEREAFRAKLAAIDASTDEEMGPRTPLLHPGFDMGTNKR